jgi:hypothetical protein
MQPTLNTVMDYNYRLLTAPVTAALLLSGGGRGLSAQELGKTRTRSGITRLPLLSLVHGHLSRGSRQREALSPECSTHNPPQWPHGF